ncbi:MAG: hypothetical protein INR71_04555, partial [Terriglobus roseus]|nr:hypothetical protein [Terriglobus roseus]
MDDQLSQQWIHWVYTHSKQRLLLACNVLLAQTIQYLTHEPNTPILPWHDLILPCSTTLWEASNAAQWRALLTHEPLTVSIADTLKNLATPHFHYIIDRFQSIILMIAHATSNSASPATSQALRHALPEAPEVQIHLHATLMSLSAPLRALLAVAGESWTPAGARLATHARAAADVLGHMKQTLRTWVSAGFAPGAGASSAYDVYGESSAHRAVQHALAIVRLAAKLEDEQRPLPFAGEMPLYEATLVLWAVGFEATRRTVIPQYGTMTPPASGASDITTGGARGGVVALIHLADSGLLGRVWGGGDVNAAVEWR